VIEKESARCCNQTTASLSSSHLFFRQSRFVISPLKPPCSAHSSGTCTLRTAHRPHSGKRGNTMPAVSTSVCAWTVIQIPAMQHAGTQGEACAPVRIRVTQGQTRRPGDFEAQGRIAAPPPGAQHGAPESSGALECIAYAGLSSRTGACRRDQLQRRFHGLARRRRAVSRPTPLECLTCGTRRIWARHKQASLKPRS
jgi:hypothetical protein